MGIGDVGAKLDLGGFGGAEQTSVGVVDESVDDVANGKLDGVENDCVNDM